MILNNSFLINLTSTEFRLSAEEQAKARFTVYNYSDKFHSYQLIVDDSEKDWVTFDRKYMSALPKEETEEAWLILKPSLDAREGNYEFIIKVIASSENLPDVQEEVKVHLEIIGSKETLFDTLFQGVLSEDGSNFSTPNKPNQISYPTTLNFKARILPDTAAKPTPAKGLSWQIEVKNEDIEDRITDYSLCVIGLPAIWSTVEPPQIPLNSKESGILRLVVQPGDNAPSGTYNFMLRVYSQLNPQERVEIPCRFEINSYDFNKPFLGLSPIVQDRNGALEINLSERIFEVRPGQETLLEVTLLNHSQTELAAALKVAGVPKDWYELVINQIELGTSQSSVIPLKLRPPVTALPGSYMLALQAQTLEASGLSVKLVTTVEVIDYFKPYVPEIRLDLEPKQQIINFDNETSLNLTIHNQSARHDVYSIKIEGTRLKPEWVTVEQVNPQVPPFGKNEAILKFCVPLDADIAGTYPLQLKVFSNAFWPELEAKAIYFLQAPIVGDYNLNLRNNKINAVKEASYQIEVSNQANAPLYLKFSVVEASLEEAPALFFRFTPTQLEIPAKSKSQVTLMVNPRYRVDSDVLREFEIKSEGYYLINDNKKQSADSKLIPASFVQEVAPTLIIDLEPDESETDQIASYILKVTNPSSERVKVQFSATANGNQLDFNFEPNELTLNPKEFGRTDLTVIHRQKASSSQPKIYNFKVQAKYAGEGLASVMPGLEKGRFIHKAAKKLPLVAIAGAVLASIALGIGIVALLPKINQIPTLVAVITPTPITTVGNVSVAQATTSQPVSAQTTTSNTIQPTTIPLTVASSQLATTPPIITTPTFVPTPTTVAQAAPTATPVPPTATPIPIPTAIPTATPIPSPTNTAIPTATSTPLPIANFTGTWNTNFAQVTLNQTGATVSGTYIRYGETYDNALNGTVTGNTLTGYYVPRGSPSGPIKFVLSSDGNTFTGSWNNKELTDTVQWCGIRVGIGPLPTGCGFSGTWQTNFATVNLTQYSDSVNGNYIHYGKTDSIVISGRVAGGTYTPTLNGIFGTDANNTLVFTLNQAGSGFDGNWQKVHQWCGVRSGALPNDCGFSGKWNMSGGVGVGTVADLVQDGKSVTGTYGNNNGTVSGIVDGWTLSLIGTWKFKDASGPFMWIQTDLGTTPQKFRGNYNGSIPWCGYRNGTTTPDPCLAN
jgi:uncharacterized membrane protein